MPFSTLERKILTAKGLTEEQLTVLSDAGVASKDDLKTVGDAATLRELIPSLDGAVSDRVMTWAMGQASTATGAAPTPTGKMILDTADVVYCVHCSAKQPKDYKSGDLCGTCGRQAEPILSCFWCASSGPGAFCRKCGTRFVPTAEMDLAVILKQDGLPKDEIPKRLEAMLTADKELLWGRVRRSRV